MSWTTYHYADGIYVTFCGDTTGDELVRANTDFHTHARNCYPRFAVFDFSSVRRFDVDRAAMDHLIAQNLIAADAVPELAVAIVAPEPATYYAARVWEHSVEHTAWRMRIVRSAAGALRWLSDQGITTVTIELA